MNINLYTYIYIYIYIYIYEAFATKLSVVRKRKTNPQGRNGNRTYLSDTRRE